MSTSRDRAFTFRLPHRALWIALGAFVAGLLLFAIVWLSNRGDESFYSVKPADQTGTEAASAPLPEPAAANQGASGMQAPSAGAQAQADAGQTGASAFPAPVAEETAPSTDAATTPAASAPAAAAPPQNRATPLPIDGQSPPPTYPPAALRKGETGTVMVRIQVDAQGNPGGVALIQRSGSRDLDRAAMEAVRKWKFQPAIDDGQPVAGTVDIPVEFNLER